MKIKSILALALLSIAQTSIAANYILTIDGNSYEIALDKDSKVRVGDKKVGVRLTLKDIFAYQTESFSFDHPKEYSPSTTDLGEGIMQTVLMTPLGSVVLVQEYSYIDPSSLMDLMINEVTKEEKAYGYKIAIDDASVVIANGEKLSGKKVTSTYPGSTIERYLYSYGKASSGLFIMTQTDAEIDAQSPEFVAKIVDSLKITM